MDEDAARTPSMQALAPDRGNGAPFGIVATVPDEGLRRLGLAVGDDIGAFARDPILPVERLRPDPRFGP